MKSCHEMEGTHMHTQFLVFSIVWGFFVFFLREKGVFTIFSKSHQILTKPAQISFTSSKAYFRIQCNQKWPNWAENLPYLATLFTRVHINLLLHVFVLDNDWCVLLKCCLVRLYSREDVCVCASVYS